MFKIAKSRYPSIWMCISPCGCWTEEWINKRLRKNYRSQFSSKERSQLPKAQGTSKGAAFRTGSEHLAGVSLACAFAARPWDTPALRTAGGEGAWPFGDTGGEFNQHQEPLRDFRFCEEMASVIYISWIFQLCTTKHPMRYRVQRCELDYSKPDRPVCPAILSETVHSLEAVCGPPLLRAQILHLSPCATLSPS